MLQRNIVCAWITIAAALLGACRSQQREPPQVQPSSTAAPARDVKIDARRELAPACVVVQLGQTVEWWVDPATPAGPINVTSVGRPVELFSPNLVSLPKGGCAFPLPPSPPARACWRHTFAQAGCFRYHDTNLGGGGQEVVDPYYGTTTVIGGGGGGGGQEALVCVEGPGVSCFGVCCNGSFDCAPGLQCSGGRCRSPSDQQPSPCPAPPRNM